MKFRDYLKDRGLFIIFYFINSIFVMVVMMLDLIIRKERVKISNIVYALILSLVFLILLISIDYSKKKRFYNAINNGLEDNKSLEYIFNIPDNISKEHDIYKELLTKNYMIYENTLDKYKRLNKIQLDFNNRWIHQMKTPISVIKLILENEKDKNIDENTKKSYESIEEEIEKLSNGLEMALYALRVNDFGQDFRVEEINILEIVRNVINDNKNAFITNSVYPKIISEEDKRIKSDRKWIKFVVNQVISNSIKYTKVKKDKKKFIKVKVEEESERIILTIEDTGIGIPRQDLDRVFNPFFTGENGRRYKESTGMGLYLTKYIIDRLGHDIFIESQEGIGTKVHIIFYQGRNIYDLES
ncbi:sensor histidine kinase [Schnuerera ultunensis]|uniref:histidine kinase n=1 Tax=[Clostridium] ultunense Esp TaxID=1288971 RepID=A0A1M4PMM4_9FIRM|nr:sensor histidine kinase [Schnuerera ultunensis]SHD76751.1 ATPase, histidine kinase-, DNA gyrase B-, and HSP90-like domain protein [[Clostridium] ultunense Esp]